MLKIKKHFHIPNITLMTRQLQLSPVLSDNDELTRAIENDIEARDDNWTLVQTPDTKQLEEFWDGVVEASSAERAAGSR